MMNTASNEYRDGILLAWQGEQWGKAFFEGVAQATEDAGQRTKWEVLAELEEVTGNRLRPLLDPDAELPSAEDYRALHATVNAYAALSWTEALKQMIPILDPAIERFEQLLQMAPDEHRETVQILVDHELALKRFAERELAGDPRTSLDPVRAVIERARATQPGNVRC